MSVTEALTSPLVIVGAGGHGRVVASLARRVGYAVRGFLDYFPESQGAGLSILGGDEYLTSPKMQSVHIAMGLGSHKIWERRRALSKYIDGLGLIAPRLIDPDTSVASSVEIGWGTQVVMGARVQDGASIEEWCIVNTAAVVEHECRISSNTHIAPGAVLCGGVSVGEGSLVGAGAVVKQGVTIGSFSTVALGAVVVQDVADGHTVAGVPARRIDVNE